MLVAIKESCLYKSGRQAVAVKRLPRKLKAAHVVRSLLKKPVIINVKVIAAANPVIVRL